MDQRIGRGESPSFEKRMDRQKSDNRVNPKHNALPPAGLSAAIVFILLVNAGILLYSCFYFDFNKNTGSITLVMSRIYGTIRDAERMRDEAILDYDRHTESHLLFARKLIGDGHFDEGDAARVQAYTGLNNFVMVNETGKILSTSGDTGNLSMHAGELIEAAKSAEEEVVKTEAEEELYSAVRLKEGLYGMTVRREEDLAELFGALPGSQEIIDRLYDGENAAFIAENGMITNAPVEFGAENGIRVNELFQGLPDYRQLEAINQYWGITSVKGRRMLVTKFELDGSPEGKVIYYCADLFALMRPAFNTVLILVLFEAAVFIVSMFYLCELRRTKDPAPGKKGDLPAKTMIIVLVSVLLITAAAFYSRTLSCLSSYVSDDGEELAKISAFYEESKTNTEDLRAMFSRFYENDSVLLGKVLDDFPTYRSEEAFAEFSKLFHLDYLVLFDHLGNEILSDGGFVNLSLSENPEDPSHAFRTILNGVPVVVQEPCDDDLTGFYHQVIGVIQKNGEGRPDGLIQAAWPLDEVDRLLDGRTDSVILQEALTNYYNSCFIIDPDTRIIETSPMDLYNGYRAEDCGFTEKSLAPGFSGNLSIGSTEYFASSTMINNKYVFIAIPEVIIYGSRGEFTLIAALLAVMDFAILLFLLGRVRILGKAEDAAAAPIDNVLEEVPVDAFASSRTVHWKDRWEGKTPAEKTAVVIRIISTVFLFLLFFLIVFRIPVLGKSSVLSYIMKREWQPGFHVFSITWILVMTVIVIITVDLVREGLSLLGRILPPRAETICRLCRSFIEYISVIVTIYAALAMLGFNMQTLLASAGILTLVIGLGANDLIADIIAGLFLIFEGEFQVGDVIEVNGRSGTVKEIGIHTIKLLDENNNLLIMNNSSVSNIVNKTLKNSYAKVVFTVPNTVKIKDLDELFANELPKIEIRGMVSAPFFKGITGCSDDGMMGEVLAEVKEIRRGAVQNQLYGEVIRILSEHSVPFGKE